MGNIIAKCLKEGDLTNTEELGNILGKNWDEELIRKVYPIAISNLLSKCKIEIIYNLIGLEGKTILSKVDNAYYLFEDIDNWCHQVYATKPLMQLIIQEMKRVLKSS